MADGVVVDRRSDKRLDHFLYKAANKLQAASNEAVTAMMIMALFVSEACGRSGQAPKEMFSRCQKHLERVKLEARTKPLLLGSLLGDPSTKKKQEGFLGVGLARHRALLFKVLADSTDNPDTFSTLECDEHQAAAWNTVTLNGTDFVVDVLLDPGALYEAGSAKHLEYVRLADPFNRSDRFATISGREDLRGRVPRPIWHVEPKSLLCGRASGDTLGRGGFGEVFKGIWEGTAVAIKVVKVKNPTDLEVLDFLLEIALLARLSHPNVMRFWRGCVELDEGRRSLLLVTEFAERGGLSSLLHGHGGRKLESVLSFQQNLWLSLGIAQGTHYLHACKVLHLDLKSPNVLIDNSWEPKICDFGLAKICAASEGAQAAMKTTIRGVSPIWAPPEMFDDEAGGMTDKADVYSYGIILFEIFFRALPYTEVGMKMLPQAKYDGLMPLFPKDAPPDCSALLRHCYARKPIARPSMASVLTSIREIAQARQLSLVDVVMPPWEEELAPANGPQVLRLPWADGATPTEQAKLAAQEPGQRAARQKERLERLGDERRELLVRLRQARERRRQMQLEHLGKPFLTGEREGRFGGTADEVDAKTSVVDAKCSASRKGEAPRAGDSKRACCSLL